MGARSMRNAQMSEPMTIADYEEAFRDHRRLVREIDVIINGEAGAAPQASLCDLVGQIQHLADMARSHDIVF